jgi:hypothetical protein
VTEIALRQGLHVQVGSPFLERVQGKLQERARTIIERRPDLEHCFDDQRPKAKHRTVGFDVNRRRALPPDRRPKLPDAWCRAESLEPLAIHSGQMER